MILRARQLAVLSLIVTSSLPASGCGDRAVSTPPQPITTSAAKRAFLALGFTFGCRNLTPSVGVVDDFGIARNGTKDHCEPNLGGFTIYRDSVAASQACAPASGYFCGTFTYRALNVVLYVDPGDSPTLRRLLLKALGSLGTPTRLE